MPGASTVVSEWGLVCDNEWTPSIIITVQMVGVFAGSYITGHLGDCKGRRTALYSMLGLHAVTNLLAAFSPSWQVFMAVRFFIGLALGGIVSTGFMFPLEFMSQLWRGVVGSIPTWNIGNALFSLTVVLLKNWRSLHYLAAVLSGLSFLTVIWVPESLRWLAVHGRDGNATSVATKIARMNKRPVPSPEHLTKTFRSERRSALAGNGFKVYTYLDLFRDTKLCKTSIIMGFIWVCMSFVYFGIGFGVQALSGDFYFNFLILAVMEVPSILFVMPAMTFLTRRWAVFVFFLMLALGSLGIPLTTFVIGENDTDEGNALKENIILGLTVIAKVSIVSVWNVTLIYCGELYPTAVRNLAFGYLNLLARLGGLPGPLLFPKNPSQLHVIMSAMGGLTLVCAGLVLLLPETKGAPLEDMIRSDHLSVTVQGDSILVNERVGTMVEEEDNDPKA